MIERSWMQFPDSSSDNLKSKTCPELCRRIENRKWPGLFAIVVALTVCGARAEAQQPTKVPRIGYLTATSHSAIAARVEAFRQGLRELGYVEGKNIVIEWRYGEGKADRLSALAAELVRLKVDVIVTSGSETTGHAKEATVTIPIVMAQDRDPVGTGFVASLARPGGNITGLSRVAPEISGKQVELLKEIVPKLSRVAVLGSSTQPGSAQVLKETELAAGAFGVKLQYLDVLNSKDIETAFRAASKGRADAVLLLSGAIFNSERTQVCRTCGKEPAPGDIQHPRICGRRRADELRRKRSRLVSPRRYVCGQDPQGCQAC